LLRKSYKEYHFSEIIFPSLSMFRIAVLPLITLIIFLFTLINKNFRNKVKWELFFPFHLFSTYHASTMYLNNIDIFYLYFWIEFRILLNQQKTPKFVRYFLIGIFVSSLNRKKKLQNTLNIDQKQIQKNLKNSWSYDVLNFKKMTYPYSLSFFNSMEGEGSYFIYINGNYLSLIYTACCWLDTFYLKTLYFG
jgi:hypothetical protein